MPEISTVKNMFTKMKIERRIKGNRIIGTLGFRQHYSSHPFRHAWDLCGHPLYWWVMKMAVETKYLEKILLWTEDKEAQKVAREMSDKFVIFNRTVEECKEPMWEFVDDLKSIKSRINTQKSWIERDKEIRALLGFEPTLMVNYAANQPLVRPENVTKLIEKYFEDDTAESARMMVKTEFKTVYIRHPKYPEYFIPYFDIQCSSRQELFDTFFYAMPNIEPYKGKIHSMAQRTVGVEIGKDEYADIHNEDDLALAEWKLKQRLEKK